MNETKVSYFILNVYFDTGSLKYFLFLIFLFLYVCIIGSNMLLIVVICVNRSLHEPMYMFLCCLFINELYGSASLYPFLLLHILSDVHTVSAPLCFLQNFTVYCYGVFEFTHLAVMSYDRYLAICYPLHYTARMTRTKVTVFITGTCLHSFVFVGVGSVMTASLQFCGNVVHNVYCGNYHIIKLACFDTTVNNMFELVVASLTVCVSTSVMFYSYLRILKVCSSSCKQSRQKAMSTCTPHLASIFNYTVGAVFELCQSRVDMSGLPNMLRIFMSLYFFCCQPLFNPLMYGLNLSRIRCVCKTLLTPAHKQRRHEAMTVYD